MRGRLTRAESAAIMRTRLEGETTDLLNATQDMKQARADASIAEGNFINAVDRRAMAAHNIDILLEQYYPYVQEIPSLQEASQEVPRQGYE